MPDVNADSSDELWEVHTIPTRWPSRASHPNGGSYSRELKPPNLTLLFWSDWKTIHTTLARRERTHSLTMYAHASHQTQQSELRALIPLQKHRRVPPASLDVGETASLSKGSAVTWWFALHDSYW